MVIIQEICLRRLYGELIRRNLRSFPTRIGPPAGTAPTPCTKRGALRRNSSRRSWDRSDPTRSERQACLGRCPDTWGGRGGLPPPSSPRIFLQWQGEEGAERGSGTPPPRGGDPRPPSPPPHPSPSHTSLRGTLF